MDIYYKINDFYDIGERTGYTQYIDFKILMKFLKTQ